MFRIALAGLVTYIAVVATLTFLNHNMPTYSHTVSLGSKHMQIPE